MLIGQASHAYHGMSCLCSSSPNNILNSSDAASFNAAEVFFASRTSTSFAIFIRTRTSFFSDETSSPIFCYSFASCAKSSSLMRRAPGAIELSAADCAPRNRADANRDRWVLCRSRRPIWRFAPRSGSSLRLPNSGGVDLHYAHR